MPQCWNSERFMLLLSRHCGAMLRYAGSILLVGITLGSVAARAQHPQADIDIDDQHDSTSIDDNAVEPEYASPVASESLGVFVLDRGFYFSSDMGVFFTFGGFSGYSNVQPFVSVKGGFDISEWMSIQLAVLGGYSSGNPASEFDVTSPNSLQTRSYSILSVGPELVFALRPWPRVAVEPRVGGGVSSLYPQISKDDLGGAYSNFLPHVSAGVDIKYLTLLTNFTAGISLTFEYIIGPSVPALGAGFVVRYTL